MPAYWSPALQTGGNSTTLGIIPLDGNGKNVVFLDCDMRVHVSRIFDILVHNISQKLVAYDVSLAEFDTPVRQLAKACLRKLFIFRPASPSQLLSIVAGLPILKTSKMGLLLIDSLTQFYWTTKSGVVHLAKNQYYSFQQDFAHGLKKLLLTQRTFAVVSSWPPFPKKNQVRSGHNDIAPEQSEVRDLNSNAWILAVNYRIAVKSKQASNSNVEITRAFPPSSSGLPSNSFKIDHFGLIRQ